MSEDLPGRRRGRRDPLLVDELVYEDPLHLVHCHVVKGPFPRLPGFTDVIDWNDVWVTSGPRHGLGFPLEPRDGLFWGAFPRGEHLQGRLPAEALLGGPADDPHSAPAQFDENLVGAEGARPASPPFIPPDSAGGCPAPLSSSSCRAIRPLDHGENPRRGA